MHVFGEHSWYTYGNLVVLNQCQKSGVHLASFQHMMSDFIVVQAHVVKHQSVINLHS